MARWTKSYSVPIRVDTFSTFIVVGKEIWVMSMLFESPKHEIGVFNTETCSGSKIACPLPKNLQQNCSFLYYAVYNNQMYIWCRSKPVGEGGDKYLYRLDTKTLEWEHLLTTQKEYESCVVVGDLMYVLDCPDRWSPIEKMNQEKSKTVSISLDTIDLKKKEVVDSFELMESHREFKVDITFNNGKLYITQTKQDAGTRAVSIIEDKKTRVICKDNGRMDQKENSSERWGVTGFHNGLFFQWEGNPSMVGIDKFNYSENKWERITAEKSWIDRQSKKRECHFVEIDNIFYAILECANTRYEKELRLLEKSPDASTLSLLSMIDFCVDNNEMNRLKECGENVPEADKNNWHQMFYWRFLEYNMSRKIELDKREATYCNVEVQNVNEKKIVAKDTPKEMDVQL